MSKPTSTKILAIDAVQLATIGAQLLKEAVRVLEANGLSRDFAPGVLASAVCGSMLMSKMTGPEFLQGVEAAGVFWTDEEEHVVFLPDVMVGGVQREVADDCDRN